MAINSKLYSTGRANKRFIVVNAGTGDQGATGATGPQGEQGPQGEPGTFDGTLEDQELTPGELTVATSAEVRSVIHKFTWTNAMINAVVPTATSPNYLGKLLICTLPAKTVITNCFAVIDSRATQPFTCSATIGISGGSELLATFDLGSVANTIFGNLAAERGASASYYFPSNTATTALYMNLTAISAFTDVLNSAGSIHIYSTILP